MQTYKAIQEPFRTIRVIEISFLFRPDISIGCGDITQSFLETTRRL